MPSAADTYTASAQPEAMTSAYSSTASSLQGTTGTEMMTSLKDTSDDGNTTAGRNTTGEEHIVI